MDDELQQLKYAYQQSGDPLLREKLDWARSRAGLPVSLPGLIEEIYIFEKRIQTGLRANLSYELSEYMRKHSSLVDHIRWHQQSARDLSWEVSSDSTWIDDLKLMFKKDIRATFYDEEGIMLWPTEDGCGEETGEVGANDRDAFKNHVETHLTLLSQKESLIKAIDDAVILTDHLRSLMDRFGTLLGQEVYVVYDCHDELKVLDEDAFTSLVETLG